MSAPTALPEPASTWQVISQLEQTQIGTNSQLVKGMLVTFTTGLGNTGSVFVPDAQYTPSTVKAAIAAQAATLDAVSRLTHNS